MTQHTSCAAGAINFSETFAPAALLLAGVPVLTTLVMTAVRYVASGTF